MSVDENNLHTLNLDTSYRHTDDPKPSSDNIHIAGISEEGLYTSSQDYSAEDFHEVDEGEIGVVDNSNNYILNINTDQTAATQLHNEEEDAVVLPPNEQIDASQSLDPDRSATDRAEENRANALEMYNQAHISKSLDPTTIQIDASRQRDVDPTSDQAEHGSYTINATDLNQSSFVDSEKFQREGSESAFVQAAEPTSHENENEPLRSGESLNISHVSEAAVHENDEVKSDKSKADVDASASIFPPPTSATPSVVSEVAIAPVAQETSEYPAETGASDKFLASIDPASPKESPATARTTSSRPANSAKPARARPPPYIPSRRSWFQRTPLSNLPNPPSVRIGSAPRSPEFLWNRHGALHKATPTAHTNSFMLGWDEARAADRVRPSSPTPFLPRSPRTTGFPLRDLRRAREDPAPGQYRHWSDADSRRPGAARFSFTKGGRTAPLFDWAGQRARPVLTVHGPPDQSPSAAGPVYSGFRPQTLSGNVSGPAVGFSHSARIGTSTSHAPGRGPGPGEYDLVVDAASRRDVLAQTRHRASPSFSLPKELRPWQGRPRETEQHPFPRAFSATPLEDPARPRRLARFQTPPAWRFGSGARMAGRPSGTPGPGSYYV